MSAGTVKVGVWCLDGNNLYLGGCVAAVIGQGPGTGNDLFSFAGARGYNIRIGCIQGSITVIGLIGYISGDS